MKQVLNEKELESINGFFEAANYLSVAQIYLKDNPLLRRKLSINDIKTRLVGHFGSAPNQNFIYIHLNRIICKYKLNMFYISGPGHAGQSLISNLYLEGTYSKYYPNIKENLEGLKELCKQFSYPYGVSSHAAPETPGSIHEGGELGYSLVHAYAAILDNPNLIVACCIGDGEAETGTLATSWHLNKIINPQTDGMVLPILNLNGYKIANPTILGRMKNADLKMMFTGMGYETYFVSGSDPMKMHLKMASVMDKAVKRIFDIKKGKDLKFPLIILKSPKGWTGPKEVNGVLIENSFHSHQVPFIVDKNNLDENLLKELEKWLLSYEPNKLFNKDGKLKPKYRLFVPDEEFCMGNSLYANGGILRDKLRFPNANKYGISIKYPFEKPAFDMIELGSYLKDLIALNPDNFRIFGPDEALSNRLNHVFEITNREWNMKILKTDEYLNNTGRVIDSFLSENICEGLLEGYILTGRHGIFHTYEAFSRVVDSMISQHLKWIKGSMEVKWRHAISSLNIIVTSHIWQQDHNGYTHQEPGILDHIITKKKYLVGMYLPFDCNTLIYTMEKCLKDLNKVNVIVASKQKRYVLTTKKEASIIVKKGYGILEFASDLKPDIILTCSGDTPTLEVLASVKILKEYLNIKIRVVNIVNPLILCDEYPNHISSKEYQKVFLNKPNLYVFHGYKNVIYSLVQDNNMKVIGYQEEGAITTSFDMRVRNKIDRFNICLEVCKILKDKNTKSLENYCISMLKKHKEYIKRYGKDMDIINNFTW